MQNDPVVLALRAAIETANSVELRNALGEHLLRRGESAAALVEFEAGLALSPADKPALDGAARAAEASGDAARAAAYRLAAGGTPRVAAPVSWSEPRNEDHTPTSFDGGGPHLRLVTEDSFPGEESLPPAPTTFADVGGMQEVKARLTRAFLTPLKNPELYKKYGKRVGGGLVLYGPPGCGKTFLARALAGEIGARFLNIGLADVLDMWFGESERKLHELLENARRTSPSLVFFDEIDALGQRRSQLKGAAGRTLVNQLLGELDGFAGRNEGVFFLGATNHPWDLDPALRRPGRFDRLLFVPPPDTEARRQILALKLAGRPLAPSLDLGRIARATDGYSGADLEAIAGTATELAIEASIDRGIELPIDEPLLGRALKDVRASTRPWFETARNHAMYANEGGIYDELLVHLKTIGLA